MPRILSGKVIGFLFLLLLLELCFLPALHLPVQPVLLYLVIPYAAFQWRWEKTVWLAMGVGLMRDLTGSQPLGTETLVLSLAAAGLDFFVLKIERRMFLMRVITTFLFVFSVTLLSLILSGFLGSSISWFHLGTALRTALATAVFMPIFFSLAGFWFRDTGSLKQYELFG